MQTVGTSLLTKLRTARSQKLAVVIEIYKADSVPDSDGFNPTSDDCLLTLSTVSNITFLDVSYTRLITSIGDVNRKISKQLSDFSFELSNSSREVVTFEQSTGFEGCIVVARIIDRTASTTLEDSIVTFVGRLDKPEEFDKSSESVSLTAKQILNATEIPIPRRKFTAEDITGRPQSDVEFEGFLYSQRGGVLEFDEKQRRGGLLGLFGLKKNVRITQQYSSHNDINRETSIPVILGRVQFQFIPFASLDKGTWIDMLQFICDGHENGISAIENVRSVTAGFPLLVTAFRYGKIGAPGTTDPDAYHQTNDDPGWIGAGIYSRTAYMRASAGGTTLQQDDNAPDVVGIIYGLIILTPDGDGEFTVLDWSDSPISAVRWLLNSNYYFNLSDAWFDDTENFESFNYCNGLLTDIANTDTVLLPNSQSAFAGDQYNIYKSTGVLTPDYYAKRSGLIDPLDISPFQNEADYQYYDGTPYNSDDWGGIGSPAMPPTALRRRYTFNCLIQQETKALDFLYDVILPTFNGYLVQKASGKFAIRVSKPEKFTFVFEANEVGDTEIRVKNVTDFLADLGLLLIGANLENSEVRKITGYRYDTDVSLSISASGGISSSGGTLTGGDDTTAPHATLTVSSASGTKTIIIDGFSIVYVPQTGESTVTAAGVICDLINAHNELNKYVTASWAVNTSTVLVESRIGFLTLDNALAFAHLASIADPADARALTDLSGGNLPAGVYEYCQSYMTAEGETLTGPVTSITITDNHKIQTESITLPSRAVSIRHYFSTETNGVRRAFHTENDGSSFIIDSLADPDAGIEPVLNETAEECHRIALAFVDKGNPQANLSNSNVIKGSFKFPLGSRSPSTNQVKISYQDSANDFNNASLTIRDKAHIKKIKKTNSVDVNGGGIDNAHQARRIGNQLLSIWRDGDSFASEESDGEALLLEEGDIVAITDESGLFTNAPYRIEDTNIKYDGYPSINFTGRKYRRKHYDDQVISRMVPLAIVQNNAINREQVAPIIYVSAIDNTTVNLGIVNYSTSPYFRRVEVSHEESFATLADIVVTIHNAANEVGFILKAMFDVVRSTGLTMAETVYIRVAHSSNGITYGAYSNTVTATYPDNVGAGGSTPDPTPTPGSGSGSGDAPPDPGSGGGGGIGGCFIGETEFRLNSGKSVAMEVLYNDRKKYIGKLYPAFNQNNVIYNSRLKGVYRIESDRYIHARFDNGKEVKVTSLHRFWTEDKEFVSLCDLKKGQRVWVFDGGWNLVTLTYKRNKKTSTPQFFYNVEVEVHHSYFANGFAVSNQKPAPNEGFEF